MQAATPTDWKIPLTLLALGAIPCAAGLARLATLAGHAAMPGDGARFLAAPLPITLHILGAVVFCLLGALQFSTNLRQRHPQWHKRCGRLVAAGGVVAALSGIWMTLVYAIPVALQGELLLLVRLVAGTALLAAIVLAVVAAMRGDTARHRAWMIRAYALGLGAGTQVLMLLPWMLLVGAPGTLQRDVLMSLAWLLNLCIAEWLIQKHPAIRLRFSILRVLPGTAPHP